MKDIRAGELVGEDTGNYAIAIYRPSSAKLTDLVGVDIPLKTMLRANYVFVRYKNSNSCEFFIIKDRYMSEEKALEAIEKLFPMIKRNKWTYKRSCVTLEDVKDRMILKMAYNVE